MFVACCHGTLCLDLSGVLVRPLGFYEVNVLQTETVKFNYLPPGLTLCGLPEKIRAVERFKGHRLRWV